MASRRSTAVVLTLVGLPVGAIALADAFPGQEMRRNLYPDRGACERDYSTRQCEPSTGGGSSSSGSGGHGGGGYRGPYYSASSSAAAYGDPGSSPRGQVTRTETSMRGGFGALGRAFGSHG